MQLATQNGRGQRGEASNTRCVRWGEFVAMSIQSQEYGRDASCARACRWRAHRT